MRNNISNNIKARNIHKIQINKKQKIHRQQQLNK